MNQPGLDTDPFAFWGQRLLADPTQALDDILTGRAALGALQRADSADLLDDLLAQGFWTEDERQQLIDSLDAALLDWMRARIAWTTSQVLAEGPRAHIALLDTALVIAGRLLLPKTAASLADEQAWWEDRLAVLRWPGELDVLASLDTVLAMRQSDWRFAPRWFAGCEAAAWGAPGWQITLDNALLGLRRLPYAADGIPELSVALGLGRFATRALERGLAEAERLFRRKATSLSVLYPRSKDHWRQVWNEVLADLPRSPRRDAADELRSWLGRALPAMDLAASPSKGGKKGQLLRAERPHPDEREDLIRRMTAAPRLDALLWSRLRGYLDRDWRAADADGDYYYAVRSVHNLGHRMLKLGPNAEQLAQLHAWTLRALDAEPDNAHIWGLWAEVLTALGQTAHALAVRWETVRRFPEDPFPRTELAEVLSQSGQAVLAEALLHRTMTDFPRNVVCRNALVDLLLDQGRREEAEPVWRDAQALAPTNPYVQGLGQRLAEGKAHAAQGMPSRPTQEPDERPATGQPKAEATGLAPALTDFLAWLERRRGQWEAYFAGGGVEPATEGDALALAALRAGAMRPQLEQWLRARPSDVALRLVGIGPEGDGVLAELQHAFPALAGRLDWLRFARLKPDQRQGLIQAEHDRLRRAGDPSVDSPNEWWGGRLAAVYPGLDRDATDTRIDPEAWRRLRDDVVVASLDLAIPAIA